MLSTSKVDLHSFVLCCYTNCTNKIQIIRIVNIEQWYFEKVIFPQQRLLFNAPAEAELEIYANDKNETTQIRCEELLVK